MLQVNTDNYVRFAGTIKNYKLLLTNIFTIGYNQEVLIYHKLSIEEDSIYIQRKGKLRN